MKPLIMLSEINNNTMEQIDTVFSRYRPILINKNVGGLVVSDDKRIRIIVEGDSIRRVYTFLKYIYRNNPRLAHKYVFTIWRGVVRIVDRVPCEKIDPDNLNKLMDMLYRLEPSLFDLAPINMRKLLRCVKKSTSPERKLALFRSIIKAKHIGTSAKTKVIDGEISSNIESDMRASLERSIYSGYTHSMEILRKVDVDLAKTISAELIDRLIEKLKKLTAKSPTLYLCGLPRIVEMLYKTDRHLAHVLAIQYINALSRHLENASIISRLTRRISPLNRETKEALRTLALEMHFLISDIAEVDQALAKTLAIMVGRTIIKHIEPLDPEDSIGILNVIFQYFNTTELDILREASTQWELTLSRIFRKIVASNDHKCILRSLQLLGKIYNINSKVAEEIWDAIKTYPGLAEVVDIDSIDMTSFEFVGAPDLTSG